MGDRARGKGRGETGTAGRTQSPKPKGRGKAGTTDTTQSPETTGRASTADRTRSAEPAGRGRAAGTAGRTLTPVPGGTKGRGRAVAAAGRDIADHQAQLSEAGRRGKGREAAAGGTPSQEPKQERRKAEATAGRKSSGRAGAEGDIGTARSKAITRKAPAQSLELEKGKAAGNRDTAGGDGAQCQQRQPAARKKTGRSCAATPALGADAAAEERAADGGGAQGAAAGKGKRVERSGTLRELAESLRLRGKEISSASKPVNDVVDTLVKAIKKHEPFRDIERLATGSYYEGVKISKPDEFDIMLKIPLKSVVLDKAECGGGAFYYVKLESKEPKRDLSNCLNENGYLLSSEMISHLRKVIKKEICKIKMNVSVKRKKPGCPAVTLLIEDHNLAISVDIVLALEVQQRWPSNTEDGLKIEPWLGSTVRDRFRSNSFYLVAKQAKDGRATTDTWRISFSHIEKEMLNNHGNGKTCCESNEPRCCRKFCLRLLKHFLQNLQHYDKSKRGLEKFCSYHIKTTFFHSCVSRPTDQQWQLNDLSDCFEMFLDDFIKRLKERDLPHFFIPSFNLFAPREIDENSLKCLLRNIEHERNNKFPIFQLCPP
ncbi:cyclic GMP-AMP synthase [Microcaecilia unicolor]|uniref:Cyclic GMP-AMP synthase n=1 Tax=Microcaecilia unicolor TaxID=1415580 RepID=A0A6P7XWQ0_9AMPH|nr:cyclic GMP-AMP synthase [Microcaecilia unicolor]